MDIIRLYRLNCSVMLVLTLFIISGLFKAHAGASPGCSSQGSTFIKE